MSNNYKLKASAVSSFSCSGCSNFADYLTKADIAVDSDGYFNLDSITTHRSVDKTWYANNLQNRYSSYYLDADRATFNRLLVSDVWNENVIGKATIDGFKVGGSSKQIVLAGTVPNFFIGLTFKGSADYYYSIERTNTQMIVKTLNRSNGSVNTTVKLITVHFYADGSYGCPTAKTETVNSYTFDKSHFLSPIPFRGVCWGGAGGGAGSSASTWSSGGGGAGGGCFLGLLDFLGDTSNGKFLLYVGDGGSPGATGGSGKNTIIYGYSGSSSLKTVVYANGGGGGSTSAGGSAGANTTMNMTYGVVFDNGSGRATSYGAGAGGGAPNNNGGGMGWSNDKFHAMPNSSMWGYKGYSLTDRSGGAGGGSSFGGGGGASAWGDGEGHRNGLTNSTSSSPVAGWGGGGGGLRYTAGLSSSASYKWGGYGGNGFVEIYF